MSPITSLHADEVAAPPSGSTSVSASFSASIMSAETTQDSGQYQGFAKSIDAEIDRMVLTVAPSAGAQPMSEPTGSRPNRPMDAYVDMSAGIPSRSASASGAGTTVRPGPRSAQSAVPSQESPLPRYDDLPDPPPVPPGSEAQNAAPSNRLALNQPPSPETPPMMWGRNSVGSSGDTRAPLIPSQGNHLTGRERLVRDGRNLNEPEYARVDLRYKRGSKCSVHSRHETSERYRLRMEPQPSLENDTSDSIELSPTPPRGMSSHFEAPRVGVLVPQRATNGDYIAIPMSPDYLPRINPLMEKEKWKNHSNDAIQAVASALYCKILVILGLAFPMAETISDNVPQGYYQLFYVYLFLVSLLFLMHVYLDVMWTRVSQHYKKKRLRSQSQSKNNNLPVVQGMTNANGDVMNANNSGANNLNASPRDVEDGSEDPIYQENLLPRPRVHYGSFYLRLGCVLFGIGGMIYSGIEIGMYFELNFDGTSECKNLFSVVRPVLQMIFVFSQMYFVFLNQKMNIYKNKFISRLGLMHMIATNLCVWLNVLILETNHEIHEAQLHNHGIDSLHGFNVSAGLFLNEHGDPMARALTERRKFPTLEHSTQGALSSQHFDLSNLVSLCSRKSNIMSKLLADSGPFLFPCTIEYSLICAAVLFVMWKNIADEHEHYKFQKKRRRVSNGANLNHMDLRDRPAHHYSVDCTHANTGLFTGIFVMVLTIISLIVFFVLIASRDPMLQASAITLASMTELSLYIVTSIAVIIGMYQVRGLWYETTRKMELDNLLLIVAQTGVFIYAAFSIIGSFFQLQDHLLAFLASLATLVQTTLQTVFILDASSRFAYCAEQVRRKPGREVVTFLLVCNLAMWAINTLETNRADSHPIQVKFYGGDWAWPIITHISMPLAIFYRFHSTVCLCEIWKKSFKYKPNSVAYINALVPLPQIPMIESMPDHIDESQNNLSVNDSKSMSDLNDEYMRNSSQDLGEDEDGQDSMELQNKENSLLSHSESDSFLPESSRHGGNGGITFVAQKPSINHNASFSQMSIRSKKEIINDPSLDISEWKKKGLDSLQAVASALYCKILVILGLAFPMSEVISSQVPRGYYQLFYVYLFLGSLLYLLFVYIDLLRNRAHRAVLRRRNWMENIKKKIVIGDVKAANPSGDSTFPTEDELKQLSPSPMQVYGSFYIRMGALRITKGSGCQTMFVLVRPLLKMIFVFVQMYFIFLNQKMNVYRRKLITRFGLMHMIATNICIWLHVLILETYHEITEITHKAHEGGHHEDDPHDHHHDDAHEALLADCSTEYNVMGQLLAGSGPFLFPCTIEYSLICAAILYMMWKNVVEEHEHFTFKKRRKKISIKMKIPMPKSDLDPGQGQQQRYSVDCSNANNGLFCGIFVMVFTIISLVVFFVLIKSTDDVLHQAAITVASWTEVILYTLTTLAVIIGMIQIRSLWYDSSKKIELDNFLLVVAQTGVLIYSSFSIIGAFFQWQEHLMAFIASLVTLIQTMMQTVFILDASNRFAYCAEQVKRKPGREVVTFLLVCNLAMWAINTLETNRADSHPIQVKFYGGEWVWPIITHFSMPLAIFYRFHSTVCLCEIWTNSFKYKEFLFEV
ncbi:hypothetical protein TCAL_10164 [Tigriopus californicus]|uniref:Otopetrin n=1 Tax=Tigriopus californicus TaxID=6832 RepID=A0A553P7D6_TIGCA|nr:hypothetical protein TCAL_10164 [Tigriopus californicus]